MGSQFLGTFDFDSAPFDWGEDEERQRLDLKDLVIYEMPVRGNIAITLSYFIVMMDPSPLANIIVMTNPSHLENCVGYLSEFVRNLR
jgi:hypothetical protein